MSNTAIPKLPFTWKPNNKMLICSLASGPKHTELLRLTAPTFSYYALTHDMDCLALPLNSSLSKSRPPAWDKLILIHHALKLYETVMWIDADAIIVDPKRNICDVLNPKYSMHLVYHDKGPGTGVWICRRSPHTFKLLDAVWNHKEFIHHPWWEQAALMDLLGYEAKDLSLIYRGPTLFTPYVQYLKQEWNYPGVTNYAVIRHYFGPHKQIEKYEASYAEFLSRISVP